MIFWPVFLRRFADWMVFKRSLFFIQGLDARNLKNRTSLFKGSLGNFPFKAVTLMLEHSILVLKAVKCECLFRWGSRVAQSV
jgi:hypothetical protein